MDISEANAKSSTSTWAFGVRAKGISKLDMTWHVPACSDLGFGAWAKGLLECVGILESPL